jgi:hypothetical protein
MPISEPPWLQFVNAEIEPLGGMLGGFLVGSVFAFWPTFGARLYASLFPIRPGFIRLFGYCGLAWGVWSASVLVAHLLF